MPCLLLIWMSSDMNESNLSRALEHMRILIGLRYRDLAFYMQKNPAVLAHWFAGRKVPSDHELENFVEFFCKEISGMNNHIYTLKVCLQCRW